MIRHPARAKGRRYPVEISCVAWMDLLGYGAMLEEVAFDPSNDQAEAAIDRLQLFQKTVSKAARRDFPAMLINDGVAFFRDLSPRSHTVSYVFLERAISIFDDVNRVEREKSYPGARLIIAVGPRMRMEGVIRDDDIHKESILARLRKETISAIQAVHEAFRSGPIAGFVPALQANFAFTKAYLADAAGTKGELGGPQCYIDLALFGGEVPEWLKLSRMQRWSGKGLSAIFGELKSIDREAAKTVSFQGALDAVAVSRHLGIMRYPRIVRQYGGRAAKAI